MKNKARNIRINNNVITIAMKIKSLKHIYEEAWR
tara:strand:+ start:731 stop:832 length:102 start_codon:yes stop_codon:yes gene_type:complete